MHPQDPAEFERYSDDARRSMLLANREAIRHLQPEIHTPHLLIALVRERTGLAGFLLRQRGLTARRVRRAVRRSMRRAWALNFLIKLPLSSGVKAIVLRATEHAISEKHDSVGTGGLLLAMMRHDPQSVDVLRWLDVDVAALQNELVKYLHRFMVEAPGQVLQFDPPTDVA